jgi:AcrR family transcriptional regulator
MDRRQQKTRHAIFQAFTRLLERRRYDRITVGEIIEEANVGRSTFYAHFETKDMLLKVMCQEMFYHIFEGDPCPWTGHGEDLQGKLTHTLWHLRGSHSDVTRILRSDSAELFVEYLRQNLQEMFRPYLAEFSSRLPEGFLLNHLAGSFAEAIRWWLGEEMTTEPETMAGYFLAAHGLKRDEK